MRKFRRESSAPDTGADRDNSGGWLSGHRCALALAIIVVVAFVLRFIFAYGVSADGDFALSGGSSAQYHLHVIETILNGTYSFTDASVNYPVGGILFIPPLMDFLGAGIAMAFQGGMGTTEAASFSLAVLNPIFGALACIPVYLIGREMFDKTIGVVAALIFAFLALPISTSVFSSGNEYALASFLLAFMAYFAVRMVKALGETEPSRKSVLVNAVITGIFLALAALTWSGFRVIVIILVVAMVLQAVFSRVRGKDYLESTIGYSVAILVGTLIPALYYIPAGLMDAIYSGPLMIAIVSVVFAFAFVALKGMPWVKSVPALVIVFIAFAVVLFFVSGDMFKAFFFDNSAYSSEIMSEMASNRVSMSNVAAYYGWLTMWLPVCLALYETYVYFRRDKSAAQLFMVLWLFGMFFSVWANYATAAVVGSVFAVGSAAAIVKLFRAAKLKDWKDSIRTAGFPGCFRKLIKPFPFISVIIVAFLVVVPNAAFAVDAGMPSNTEGDLFFANNTSFTIRDGDSYPVGAVWDEYKDQEKDGAIVTWIDYAYDAVTQGGYANVTDAVGGGASAAAQMYLANGTQGVVAGMLLRLILSDESIDYSSCFPNQSVYRTLKSYIDDPESAKQTILEAPEVYGSVRSDMTDENAIYLAGIECITSGMTEMQVMNAYERVCGVTSEKIGYMLFDGSMLPLQYRGSDSFATMAYFANYSVDSYGAPTQFYSYNTYFGTTTYTNAIYGTAIWRALIGPSATEAGYSSSYGYLVGLSVSDGKDGSAMAMPGYGLTGFKVAYWSVMYNPDNDATVQDEGWERMEGYSAIEKQKAEGGVINYLQGIVLLEYVGVPSGAKTVSGNVVSSNGNPMDGAVVSIYKYDETYGKEILYSSEKTVNGEYNLMAPVGDYRLTVSIGNIDVVSYDGNPTAPVIIPVSSAHGTVEINDEIVRGIPMMIQLKSGTTVLDFSFDNGEFTVEEMLPGTYSYTLLSLTGTSLGTGNVTLYPGDSTGLVIKPTTRTITVTVNNIFGKPVDGTVLNNTPVVTATNTTDPERTYSAEVGADGKAVITVLPGTYTVSVGQGMVSIYSNTQNASSSNRSVTLTAYESQIVSINGAGSTGNFIVTAGEFGTSSYEYNGQQCFDVPIGLATDNMAYTVIASAGNSIYYGVYTGGDSVTVRSTGYTTVSGTLMGSSKATSGTIFFHGNNNFVMSVATDEDGKFTAMVPNGTYTMVSTNGGSRVGYQEVSFNGGSQDLGDVETVDGRKVTATLKYDPATSENNKNLPFALAFISLTYEDKDYVFNSMTNTSGSAYFYIPDRVAALCTFNTVDGVLNNAAFNCTELSRDVVSGTSNTVRTATIEYVGYSDDEKNVVKEVSVTPDYDMTLVFFEDDKETIEVSAGKPVMLRPGQYDAVVDGAKGGYFDGVVYIYPGMNTFVGLDVMDVVTVTIQKADAAVVKIESEGTYHATSVSNQYYFEVGYVYDITCTDNSGDKKAIVYYTLDLSESTRPSYTVDLNSTSTEMEVTGYVGIPADGTLAVEGNGVTLEFDIKGGSYTMNLPSDMSAVSVRAEVSLTVNNETYWFNGEANFTGMTDGCIRNVAVVNGDAPADEEKDEPTFTVDVTEANFTNGNATVQFVINNNGSAAMTYMVSSGSAWSLDEAVIVTVPGNSSVSRTVTGIYDSTRIAPGLAGVNLVVTNMNGESQTAKITINSGSGSADVSVYKAGEDEAAANDKVSASQYMYAITFVNSGVGATQATLNFTAPSGWYALIVNEDNTIVQDPAKNNKVTIYGLQTVTYYVSLMQQAASPDSEAQAPSMNISVSYNGSSTPMSFVPTDVEVETEDSNATGGDAMKVRTGVPQGIWFLLVVIILMMIIILWLASKRGVLSRK